MLSPATLIWWYRKQHPQAAGAGPRVPPPPPRLTALRRYSAGDLRQELGINPSLKVRDGGKDTVAGRQCRVLIQEYDHMVYSTGRPDPTSHTTRRMSVSVPGDLVLREVVVTRFAGDTPPRPLVVRETTSVRDLVVGSPFPDHLFRLPPGINCTVPVDYTLPLPPGVRAERRAGFGATVIGSSAPKASGPGAK
jgi:hypothetical protein